MEPTKLEQDNIMFIYLKKLLFEFVVKPLFYKLPLEELFIKMIQSFAVNFDGKPGSHSYMNLFVWNHRHPTNVGFLCFEPVKILFVLQ